MPKEQQMQIVGRTAAVPLTALWIGSMFGGFVLLFLLFDIAIKLVR
jgi:hypothetical protein